MEGFMQKTFSVFKSIAMAGVAALLLSGCGGLSEAEPIVPAAPAETEDKGALEILVEAALQEGELTIYSSASDDVLKAVVDAFTADYPGITVSTFRATGGELFNRYASEAEAGAVAADILAPSVNPDFLEDSGYFVELTTELIPNLADWPKEYVHPHHIAVAVTATTITYNTDLVSEDEVPTSWEDLLDPKWAGQAMMMDPRASDGYLSLWEILRKRFGDQFLEGIAAQGFELTNSGATAAQEVAAGAYKLAIGNYPAHSKGLIAQGAPVGLIEGLDPTPGLVHAAAISVNAPNPNAAALYVHWYMTKSAQQATCAGVYSPVKEDLPGCPSLPKFYTPAVWGISSTDQTAIFSLLGLQ
jgi:iron(III) transport system substrate-binding protein